MISKKQSIVDEQNDKIKHLEEKITETKSRIDRIVERCKENGIAYTVDCP